MKGDKGTSCSFAKIKNIKVIDEKFLQTIRTLKEVSLSASMTLEASIAVPLFIFFFINIIASIEILRVQSQMEAAVHQVGNEAMLLAYDIREGESLITGGGEGNDLVEAGALSGYVFYQIKDRLGKKLERNPVTDGVSGLNMLQSRIMAGNDIIDIVIDYKVHPIIALVGFKDFLVETRYYGHAFTGYDISQGAGRAEDQVEMVYVTEHGTVYHKDVGCKYLKPSIKSVSFDQIPKLRNHDRSKFYPCEYCGGGISFGNVFITDYGERYHSKVDCPGLKRKIYTIPISEVGGRKPCSGCG